MSKVKRLVVGSRDQFLYSFPCSHGSFGLMFGSLLEQSKKEGYALLHFHFLNHSSSSTFWKINM